MLHPLAGTSDATMPEAVGGTSAAPTFFPPVKGFTAFEGRVETWREGRRWRAHGADGGDRDGGAHGGSTDGSQEERESGGNRGKWRIEHGAEKNDSERSVGAGVEGGRGHRSGEEGSTEGLGSRARSSTVGAWRRVRAFDEGQPPGIDLVDGGVAANNPTLFALRECASMWPGRPIGAIVSLGCGQAPEEPAGAKSNHTDSTLVSKAKAVVAAVSAAEARANLRGRRDGPGTSGPGLETSVMGLETMTGTAVAGSTTDADAGTGAGTETDASVKEKEAGKTAPDADSLLSTLLPGLDDAGVGYVDECVVRFVNANFNTHYKSELSIQIIVST